MDAKTDIKARLPSRHVTEGAARAPRWSSAAPGTISQMRQVFKKSRYSADSKPHGRDVAKDGFKVGGIPIRPNASFDHGYLQGDCLTETGRTVAENLKPVPSNPNQDAMCRYADA